ncbi:signal peptide peptidase SppA [Candidatus Poribacteria bacterium]|nr:signal peptide peptidase SppA [Candidatus Poribacteria bacterium]
MTQPPFPTPPPGYGQNPPPVYPPPAPGPAWGAPPPAYSGVPYHPQAGPPPMPGYGPRPPFNTPGPPTMKRSPLPLIIGLAVLGIMGIGAVLALIGGIGAAGSSGVSLPFGKKIAVLEVEGVLGEGPTYGADTAWLREQVQKWAEDDSIKGMVVRINSPGGAVSATQDLYQAIEDFRAAGKPVIASMGDIAASGGFYVAMAADEVYANSGTLTGSVGVIMSFLGYQDLQDKVGLESRVVKSGKYKDIGSGSREMTPEEKALLDEMIRDVFEQFYAVVHDSRYDGARDALARQKNTPSPELTDEDVDTYLRSYCDGRIFSGRQALEYGMVDTLGTLDEAIDAMRKRTGVSDSTGLVHVPVRQRGLFGMFEKRLHALDRITPGTVLFEFRFAM